MARDVGTERIPVTGIDRHGADFDDGLCMYQLKVRKIFPAWLWHWLTGIQVRAGANRCGVLVVKQPRDRDDEAIVMLAWRDWVALHGDARKRAANEQKEQEAIKEQWRSTRTSMAAQQVRLPKSS